MERGRLAFLADVFMLFYNPWIQDIHSSITAWKANPGGTSLKYATFMGGPALAIWLSKTYATLAITRMLHHLRNHSVPLAQVEVRTDLGTEFDGDTVHYRPDGFHRSITAMGALHRNPPARPNANADVESSLSTIEPEFFDLEHFHDTASFIASSSTYQHFFNFARKNRSRSNLAPADLLAMRSPLLHPSILLLPPVFLDSLMGQVLSGPPALNPGCAGAGCAARTRAATSRRKTTRAQPPHADRCGSGE
ncbi:MAG: hypothetical protein LBK99_05785 [Opitutaceae bacterium]|nr:hypothetical protein [Opitutaceae bacterium]